MRHDPSGSVLTLWGACPVRLGSAVGASLDGRRCPGPLQATTLRRGDGTTAASRLPVEVARGDLLVLFTERPASTGERAPARRADHVLVS